MAVITGAEMAFIRKKVNLPIPQAGTVVQKFQHFHEFSAVVIVWLVLAPVTDMVISGSLVAFLRSNKTGFAATDDLLSKLTRCMSLTRSGLNSRILVLILLQVTIQTGLITGATSQSHARPPILTPFL